jgi:DNA repair exonuclease SbcCD ATPase subunit
VVQKYVAPKHRPFARLLTGAEVPLFDPMQWIDKMPAESLSNLIVGPSVARRLETGFKQRLEEKERELKWQEQELKRQQQELKQQEQELKQQEQQLNRQEQERRKLSHAAEMLREKTESLREKSRVRIADLRRRLASEKARLKRLRSSTSWKVTVPLRRVGKILESVRRRLARFTRSL